MPEICLNLEDSSAWKQEWDDVGKVPFTYYGDQWIGFENEQSLSIKMDHIKSRGYGGAMFWALDLDDYRGACNKTNPTKNKLFNTVVNGMANYKVPIDFSQY